MNLNRFYSVLPVMGKGMLGIFVVIGVIIIVTVLLNKITQNNQ